jgi:tetratricopeptide (TPR) repeat protein
MGLAMALSHVGPLDEAEKSYRLALDVLDKLARQHPDVPDYKDELSKCWMNLGLLYQDSERYPQAADAYKHALELSRQLAQHYDKPEYRAGLAINLLNQAELLLLRKRYDEGVVAAREAIRLRQDLVHRFRGVADYQVELAHCRLKLGALFQEAQRPREAEDQYRQILDPFEKNEPGLPLTHHNYRKVVASAYMNRGALLLGAKDVLEGEKALAACRDLSEKLVAEFPSDADDQHMLAIVLHNLSLLRRDPGQTAQAHDLLTQAIEHQYRALDTNPLHPLYRVALREHYVKLAGLLLRMGEHVELARRADELGRKFPDSWQDVTKAAAFLDGCAALAQGDVKLSAEKRLQLARAYGSRSTDLFRRAARANVEDASAQHLIAFALTTALDARKPDVMRALELAQKAVEKQPGNGWYWNTLGIAHTLAEEWKAALGALNKANDLKGLDPLGCFCQAIVRWHLDDKEQARVWYGFGVAYLAKNPKQPEPVRRFRARAAAVLAIDNPRAPKGQ